MGPEGSAVRAVVGLPFDKEHNVSNADELKSAPSALDDDDMQAAERLTGAPAGAARPRWMSAPWT